MTVSEYLQGMDADQKELALKILEGYFDNAEIFLSTLPRPFQSIGLEFEPQEDGSLIARFHYKVSKSNDAANAYIH
jgi:hypothetical protein